MSDVARHPQAGPAGAPPTLQLDGVTKRFGETVAVNDVWLKVQRGEFLTLLGPSGCGKSTLLNLIAGFLQPEAGEILIRDKCVTRTPAYQRSIGIVFQNYALFPHMTVADNVAFGLKMRKVPKPEIRAKVAQALEIVRLGHLADRKPRQLSGGQQQRVALARALVIDPEVLLLDEPLSALDKNLRADMQVELKQIQRRVGVTTVFVTHDQAEALSLSDRIAVLGNGVVQQLSSPVELYRRPANPFVAAFVGDINRLGGTVAAADGEGVAVDLAGGRRVVLPRRDDAAPAAGGEVNVFLRPEHLRLETGPGLAPVAQAAVTAHVYLGTHVEVHLQDPQAGPLRLRAENLDVMQRWPVGAQATIYAQLSEAVLLAA